MNCIQNSPPILREFLIYTNTICGKSSKTVSEYFLDIRVFFRFLKLFRGLCSDDIDFNKIPIDDIDLELIKSVTLLDLYEFINFLSVERNNSPRTRARKIASIRSYFKYLNTKAKVLPDDPAKNLDTPHLKKSIPRYLSLNESFKLLSSVKGTHKERDFAILTLFLNCGLRLSELVGIDLKDIRNDTIRILGKGNKERTIYLNSACIKALNDYLKIRKSINAPNIDALFLSERKKRISIRTVQWLVKKHLSNAGLDTSIYSTHKLRHTAATLMYQYGHVDIKALQEILGHEQLSTTEIYTHISNDTLRSAVAKNPLSNFSLSSDNKKTDTKPT